MLAKVTVDAGEWLGIYQWRRGGGKELVCAGRSPRALYKRAKGLHFSGWSISVRRAESRRALPQSVDPDRPDRFFQLQRLAFEAIAEARKRVDPNYWSHPRDHEAKTVAIEQARYFLDELAKEARRTGKGGGRKPDHAHNRRMIAVLGLLRPSDEEVLSAVRKNPNPDWSKLVGDIKRAVPAEGSDPLKKAQVLRTEFRRFCLRVHDAYQRTISGKELYEECGFTNTEWPLIRIAYMIGKNYAERERKRSETKPTLHTFQQI
jgi:hypothetical protein